MRITVNRTELASALTWASRGISRRPAVPILAGMRVTVDGGRLTLAAFDYDVSATASLAGSDHAPGSILVNGPALAAVVKAAPKGRSVSVTLEREDTPAVEASEGTPPRGASSALLVKCQDSTSRLAAMPEEDYPQLPELPPVAGVVESDAFKRSAARIVPMASRDDTLPALTAVRFELGAAAVDMAATDRYRLAVDSLEWTPADYADAMDKPAALSVPARVLADFGKATGKGGKVTVHYAPAVESDRETGQAYRPPFGAFSDDSRTITFRAEFGQFPQYRRLIPDNPQIAALVGAGALAAAVKRAAVLAERNTPVRLTFAPDSDQVTIEAGTGDEGSASERVDVAFEGSEPVTVAYNPGYLVSVLDGVDGDAWLAWEAPAKPLVVSSAGSADPFRGLLCPIQLGG